MDREGRSTTENAEQMFFLGSCAISGTKVMFQKYFSTIVNEYLFGTLVSDIDYGGRLMIHS
jgi:hypothetical protein